MRISCGNVDLIRTRLVCALFFAAFVTIASAEAPTESQIMPKANKSFLLDVDMHGNKMVVVGERGHVLVSDDQGKTWVQAKVPVAQMLTAVDLVNERAGWAVGHDGHVINTSDGGKTWIKQRDGLKAQAEINVSLLHSAKEKLNSLKAKIAVDPALGAEGQSVPAMADSKVDEDVDEAAPLTIQEQLEEAEWEVQNAKERIESAVVAPPLMDVWFANENDGWAVGAFGLLIQTRDGGNTWINRSNDIGNTDNYHLNAVNGTPDGKIFLAGEAGFLTYSNDQGQTWTRTDLGYDGTIFGLIVARDGSMVVATGLRGNTFKSIDGGVFWQAINPGIDYSLSNGVIYDDFLILVGTGGSIAISHDRGETFKQYTLPARASLSSVVALDNKRFLMFGQGGLHPFETSSAAK